MVVCVLMVCLICLCVCLVGFSGFVICLCTLCFGVRVFDFAFLDGCDGCVDSVVAICC